MKMPSVLCNFSPTGKGCPHKLIDESLEDALVTKDTILINDVES